MTDLTDLILHIYIEKTTVNLRELYKASDTNNPFEGNMRERFFEGKLLLAETYCYN